LKPQQRVAKAIKPIMADAQPANGLTEQMTQLDAARNLVLGDAAFYPQIVQGILPIIGANARLELRRWGADFLAETFASPSLPTQQKGKLSLQVLQTLKDLLEIPNEDTAVVRSVVQAAASLYPLVFRHMYVVVLSLIPVTSP
jgi:symplekin